MLIYHTDVFSDKMFGGNGLTVVICDEMPQSEYMQSMAREFKQFETVFLSRTAQNEFEARIFTVEEELGFAGHPVLGGVCVLHNCFFEQCKKVEISLKLNKKAVRVVSEKKDDCYYVTMNQGLPSFLQRVENCDVYLKALSLSRDDLHNTLVAQVVSTGLDYLLIPLKSGIERARINCTDFEEKLSAVSAKFVYLFDVEHLQGRTWDNLGNVEDVATGSAAGPMGAYLFKYGVCRDSVKINQGHFLNRDSVIEVFESNGEIFIAGNCKIVMKGQIL